MNSFALKSCSLEQFEVCLATSIYIQRGNLPPGSQRTFGTIFRSHDVEKHNLHNWQKTRIHVVQLFQVTTVEESKMKFRQSVAALGKQVVLNDSALLGSCCLIAPLCDTPSIEVRRSWETCIVITNDTGILDRCQEEGGRGASCSMLSIGSLWTLGLKPRRF